MKRNTCTPAKINIAMENYHFSWQILSKWWMFHCYVVLPECMFPNLSPPQADWNEQGLQRLEHHLASKRKVLMTSHRESMNKNPLAKRFMLGFFWLHICCYCCWEGGKMGQTKSTLNTCLVTVSSNISFQHSQKRVKIHPCATSDLSQPILQTIICL